MNPSDVRASKTLSWLLRHAAVREGLPLSSDGYIRVDQLLRHKQLRNLCVADIRRIVDGNSKQRFQLSFDADGNLMIRANQGHSIQAINNLELAPVISVDQVPAVIHGTYCKFWSSIKGTGLSRMSRVHIHFATSLGRDAVSGIRKDSQIFIYIDLEKALSDNLRFFLSANGVVLSPGNDDGLIPTRYFLIAIDRETGNSLEF